MDTGQELVALRWPAGPRMAEEVRRLWDEGVAVLPIRDELPEAAAAALLRRARPAAVVEPDGTTRLDDSVPVERGTAFCVATAGSTGEPKLALLGRSAVEAAGRLTIDYLGLSDARWVCPLPLDHVAGLMILVRSWLTGTDAAVLPAFEPNELVAAPADVVSLVPTMLRRLLDADADLSRWRWILLGGGAVDPSLLERAAAAGGRVVRTYGMTETCGGVVYDGVPLPGVEADVAADGVIRLRTLTVMDGYRMDHAATAAALVDGWFVTGDIGEWREGRLRVLGRADEMIVTGGENVSPDEVEALLATHPAVGDVAVTGRPDPEWGQVVVAYVVPATSAAPALADLRAHVKAHAPGYKAPRELVLVDSLPRLPSGKVARASLSSEA